MNVIDAVALCGLFALGCIAIHGLRQHTKRITQILTLVVLSLGPFTVLVALAMQPMATHRGGFDGAPPMSTRTMTPDTRGELSTASGRRLAQAENVKRRSKTPPTDDGTVPIDLPHMPTRIGLPEQDASPDGTDEMTTFPASENAERLK